ncbi:unnamed protein product [marine sediment metagenome]|uniref:Uncharacterized protein n=1 Tax=marine sediment metagenome TaxID=412755 RepID=X0X2M0_9ZZZZ
MKIIFNISTFASGLKGQKCLYGKFESKKAAIKALSCSLNYFNSYAHVGTMGIIGEKLVDLYPPNTLIAVDNDHYIDPEKPFSYWVQIKPKGWQAKTYETHRNEGIEE